MQLRNQPFSKRTPTQQRQDAQNSLRHGATTAAFRHATRYANMMLKKFGGPKIF